LLLDSFDDEQTHRYEAYRRAHFPKAAIRKLVHNQLGYPVPLSIGIIVAGVSKVFVGELVELGC
jgi:transcription initiation factor TFIID subunit 11